MYAVIDCNNFFVSCERVFRPNLQNVPVVVLSNNDGCIISRSNEVKKLGLPMAAPAFEYAELIKTNNVQVFSSNFSLYADLSARIMHTIASYTPNIEVYSVDEAFISFEGFSPKQIEEQCRLIKQAVQKNIGIPVSIGIASTKTLAKAANEIAKKTHESDGVYGFFGDKKEIELILSRLEVGHIWGIGRRLTEFLNTNNIFNALQLIYCDDVWIRQTMSITVLRTVWELRGIPCMTFEFEHVPKKSIVSSRSFGKPVTTIKEMKEAVAKYASRVGEKLRDEHEVATCITVSLITNRHSRYQKQYYGSETLTLAQPSNFTPALIQAAYDLVDRIYKDGYLYKKAAVLVTGLVSEDAVQRNLFKDPTDTIKESKLMKIVDGLNRTFGSDSIHFASQGYQPRWAASSKKRSPRYTTRWEELMVVK